MSTTVKLSDCIAQWLKITQYAATWEVNIDTNNDCWIQPAATWETKSIPHYQILNHSLRVEECCSRNPDGVGFDASDPDFFIKLEAMIARDNYRIENE